MAEEDKVMDGIWKNMRFWNGGNGEVFYAAYGSNLDLERMAARCPRSKPIGTAALEGWRLLFKRSASGFYATIEQDANSRVPLAIYRMTDSDEARLDSYEGCPHWYYTRDLLLKVRGLSGRMLKKPRRCIAYILREDRPLGAPSAEYYRLLDGGYERWGVEKEPLHRALEDSIGYAAADAWLADYEAGTDDGNL